jgi:hypothetical protein
MPKLEAPGVPIQESSAFTDRIAFYLVSAPFLSIPLWCNCQEKRFPTPDKSFCLFAVPKWERGDSNLGCADFFQGPYLAFFDRKGGFLRMPQKARFL